MTILLHDCKVVGAGAYGKVYTGVSDGKKLATKRRYITDKLHVPPGCVHVNEIDIMCRIRHPHIIHAITMQKQNPIPDSFRSDKLGPRGDNHGISFRADLIYILTDAADGDLSSFSLSEELVVVEVDEQGIRVKDLLRHFMWQILLGIAYLHAQGHIHRDIKPQNILYFAHPEDDNPFHHIRICDFDMCIPENGVYETSKAMTPEYTPPEVLTQGADVSYTPKVDIWGAGHVIYNLIKGESFISRGRRHGSDLDNYILALTKKYMPNGDKISIPSYLSKSIDEILNNIGEMNLSLDLGDAEVNDLL